MNTGKDASASIIKTGALGTDLRRRVITGLIGAPIVILMMFVGQPAFGLLIILVCMVCASELHRMICPDSRLGLVMIATVTGSCLISLWQNNYLIVGIVLLVFLALRLIQAFTIQESRRHFFVRNYIYLALGGLYVGLPLSILLLIRSAENGFLWTGMLVVNNWATDSFALLGGRAFGKRKLAPKISPGKTVEGSLIGMFCGFTIGVGVALLVNLPLNVVLVANLLISILTVLGDLLESWVKRVFHIKDAGNILPGHGGFMDRVDGLLLAGPALYFVMVMMHIVG